MPEAAKAFRTPAKMDDESQAASETKSDESMTELGEERIAPIEGSRERLGRISEDPEGAQEPFLMGLDGTNKMEPGGAEWDDELSENNSDDWRESYARDSTTFPQLTPLKFPLKNLKRSKLWKCCSLSSIALSPMIRVIFG